MFIKLPCYNLIKNLHAYSLSYDAEVPLMKTKGVKRLKANYVQTSTYLKNYLLKIEVMNHLFLL
jgi:hypothetical protein